MSDDDLVFALHGEEKDHMVSGIFWGLVREIYGRLASDVEDPAPGQRHELLTTAIKEAVAWFPPKLKERIDASAERMAAHWLGMEYVQPD